MKSRHARRDPVRLNYPGLLQYLLDGNSISAGGISGHTRDKLDIDLYEEGYRLLLDTNGAFLARRLPRFPSREDRFAHKLAVEARRGRREARRSRDTARDARSRRKKKSHGLWGEIRQSFAAPPARKSDTRAAKRAAKTNQGLTPRQQLGREAFIRQQQKAHRARMVREEGAFTPIGGRAHLEHLGRREERRQTPWYKRIVRKQARRAQHWADRDPRRTREAPRSASRYEVQTYDGESWNERETFKSLKRAEQAAAALKSERIYGPVRLMACHVIKIKGRSSTRVVQGRRTKPKRRKSRSRRDYW